MDRPPSYTEAMKMPPLQEIPRPTAPLSDEFATGSNRRFKNWDDKATMILISRRSKKHKCFINATSALETDKLWHLILLELIKKQYNDFSIVDLKQYWEYLYQTYRSILNGSSTSHNSNWIYYRPMFKILSRQSYSNDRDTSGASDASMNGGPSYKPRSQILKKKWDDESTEILIMRRITMNDQFNEAETSLDVSLLWKTILLELNEEGYNEFLISDLSQFWEYQFEVYKSIVQDSSRLYDRTWKYFEPMHEIFKMEKKLNVVTTQPTPITMATPSNNQTINRQDEIRSRSYWWCCGGGGSDDRENSRSNDQR